MAYFFIREQISLSMRITQMTSEQLIDSIIIWSAQEVQTVPTGNGRGRKRIQELKPSY